MVKGKSKFTRLKDNAKARGRPSWAKGSKRDFLESFTHEYITVREGGSDKTGLFYERVAKAYFSKYGFDLPFEEDFEGTPPPEDVVTNPLDFDGIEAEEVARRLALIKKARAMIGQWYRHRYSTRAATASEGIGQLLQGMKEAVIPRPRKPVAINVYSNQYYNSHLKAKFDKKWEGVKDMLPQSARLGMVRDFVRESWNQETQAFRDSFQKEIDDTYAREVDQWKRVTAWKSRTAREYYEAMQNSTSVVVPFADALADHLGMHVAILMVGPMEDGEIGLRSVFSSIEGARVSDIWPVQDRATFTLVEKSLKEYGKQLFTEKFCNDHRYNPDDRDPDIDEHEPEDLSEETSCIDATENSSASSNSSTAGAKETNSPKRTTTIEPKNMKHHRRDNVHATPTRRTPTSELTSPLPADDNSCQEPPLLTPVTNGVNEPRSFATNQSPSIASTPPRLTPFSGSVPATPIVDALATPVTANHSATVAEATTTTLTPFSGSAPATPIVNALATPMTRTPNHSATVTEEATGTPSRTPPVTSVFNRAYNYLCSETKSDWGHEWDLCVNNLLAFERANGFPSKGSHRLTTKSRPKELAIWMRNARPWSDQDVGNDFPAEWWGWWKLINDSADDIDIPGPNGILLVVVSVAWWGAALEQEERVSEGEESWIEAVRQVTAALKTMCDATTTGKKRKADSDDGAKVNKRSKL